MPRKQRRLPPEQHYKAAIALASAGQALAELRNLLDGVYPKASKPARAMAGVRERFEKLGQALQDASLEDIPGSTAPTVYDRVLRIGDALATAHEALPSNGSALSNLAQSLCGRCKQPYSTQIRADGLCEGCVRLPALAL